MGQVCSTDVQIGSSHDGIGVMELNGNRKYNNYKQTDVTVNIFEEIEEPSTYEKIRDFFYYLKWVGIFYDLENGIHIVNHFKILMIVFG